MLVQRLAMSIKLGLLMVEYASFWCPVVAAETELCLLLLLLGHLVFLLGTSRLMHVDSVSS